MCIPVELCQLKVEAIILKNIHFLKDYEAKVNHENLLQLEIKISEISKLFSF